MTPDIGSESQFLPTPSAFDGTDVPIRGSRQNIVMPFGMEEQLPDSEKISAPPA